MMLSTPPYCPQLEQPLVHAIDRCYGPSSWSDDLRRCVPQLVELLVETHETSIELMAPTVRRIVLERCQMDIAGDAPEHSDWHEVEAGVELLLREMEKLRRAEVQRGDWSDVPIPPQMFG